MKSLQLSYIFASIWAAFILFATIASTSSLQELPLKDLFQFDKPIHATLFGVQAWLLIRARLQQAYQSYLTIIVVSCLASTSYGMLTEYLQKWLTTSRTFDLYDFVADTIGCLIVAIWFLSKRKAFAQ